MPPRQKPGKSEQTVITPVDFRGAIIKRFGYPYFDLAASEDNKFAYGHLFATRKDFFSEDDDALSVAWSTFPSGSVLWLNPPFKLLKQFSARCRDHVRQNDKGTILLLAPLGCQDWYFTNCMEYSVCLELFPRLTFEGHKNVYPKDMALYVFHCGLSGRNKWLWKEGLIELGEEGR